MTRAPTRRPLASNCSMRNLPYRDELLFIDVFALPNASREVSKYVSKVSR